MKRIASLFVMLLICFVAISALDFKDVDSNYTKDIDDQKVYDTLKLMLDDAKAGEEKAEVLWRLSRVCVDLGDGLEDSQKSAKFARYEEGEEYAKQSIGEKPNAMAYLWKCCNIGRWGQTKGIMNSLKKADPMKEDLRTMVNDFNCLDSSEAWYTLAILFDSLPGIFGGDKNAAISYARAACDTIPNDVIYGSTYQALAEMLYARDWSAKKRSTEIPKIQKNWEKAKSNYDRYQYYEGKTGVDANPIWTNTKLGSMSDRQEALVILKYAQAVYRSRGFHTPGDEKNFNEIQALIDKWS